MRKNFSTLSVSALDMSDLKNAFKSGVADYLEIQEYLDAYQVVLSKKQLMLMLSIEELSW